MATSKPPRSQATKLTPRIAYDHFYDRYDALIGLLCLAAHEGLKPSLEDEYKTLHAWFKEQYPALKPQISPFLTPDASDAITGASDTFEALFLPETVAAHLQRDEGNLIGRLMRAQQAFDGWDASLRRDETQ